MKYIFREGARVVISNPLSGLPDDEGLEDVLEEFMGAVGTITAVDKYGTGDKFPYDIKFDDEYLEKISNTHGGMLWEEHQLDDYIPPQPDSQDITRQDISHLLQVIERNKGDIAKVEKTMAKLVYEYRKLKGTLDYTESVLNKLIYRKLVK